MRTLKEQNGSLAYAKKQADEFGKQLVQLQATVRALEESKVQAQAMADGLAGDKQRLELELATARATLEAQKGITDAILRRFDGGGADQARPHVEPQGQLPLVEAKTTKNRSRT